MGSFSRVQRSCPFFLDLRYSLHSSCEIKEGSLGCWTQVGSDCKISWSLDFFSPSWVHQLVNFRITLRTQAILQMMEVIDPQLQTVIYAHVCMHTYKQIHRLYSCFMRFKSLAPWMPPVDPRSICLWLVARRSSYLKGRCRLSLSFICDSPSFFFLFFFFCLAKRESFKEKWVRILEDPDWKWSKVLKYLINTVDINYELCELLGILVCLLVICHMISDDFISHSTRVWSLF